MKSKYHQVHCRKKWQNTYKSVFQSSVVFPLLHALQPFETFFRNCVSWNFNDRSNCIFMSFMHLRALYTKRVRSFFKFLLKRQFLPCWGQYCPIEIYTGDKKHPLFLLHSLLIFWCTSFSLVFHLYTFHLTEMKSGVAFDLMVKLLLGTPSSCIEVPRFETQFCFSFLLMRTWEEGDGL